MAIAIKPLAIPPENEGNIIIVQELDSSFAPTTLTAGTTTNNLGSLSESEVKQTPTTTERKSEDGKLQRRTTTVTLGTTGTLMQEDADLVNFLSDTVKGKRYLEIKYVGYYNAKYNYILKIVEITPQHSYKRGTAPGMPYESFAVSAGASITYSAAFFASVANLLSLSNFITTTQTITDSKQFLHVEV